MTETPNTGQPDKPWHARAICCGRDDGTYDFTTRGEAEVFRSHYTAAEGHDRAAIITGPASQEERDAGTVLAEYLEAMRADHGMRAMVEECIALAGALRSERDQARRHLEIAQHQLASVRALADQIQRLANYPATVASLPAEIAQTLQYHTAQLVQALGEGSARSRPMPVSPWTILGIDPDFTADPRLRGAEAEPDRSAPPICDGCDLPETNCACG